MRLSIFNQKGEQVRDLDNQQAVAFYNRLGRATYNNGIGKTLDDTNVFFRIPGGTEQFDLPAGSFFVLENESQNELADLLGAPKNVADRFVWTVPAELVTAIRNTRKA